MTKILVTGASGFIGKRLIGALIKEGHEVWALVRVKGISILPTEEPNLHYLWGDMRNPQVLDALPKDVDVAFYLMHSMADIMSDFVDLERQVAENFVQALKQTNVQQIIYLGGIVNDETLSRHLKSRLMVEDILKNSGIPITILRASIIVGEGSASFEIIRDLVEKLPLMIAPRWINTLCQPIAVRDVLFYLQNVIKNPKCLNRSFEIGGTDIITFKEAMLKFAKMRDLHRYIITVPVLTPRLSSYWLVFVTSVNFSLSYYLVESMKVNTICKDMSINEVIPHQCASYDEAIRLAFLNISQNEVTSSWMDSWEIQNSDLDIQKYVQVPTQAVLKDVQEVPIKGNVDQVLNNIWSIGGQKGWYGFRSLWNLRGLMDKLIGGVGLRRGRRHPTQLQPGDAIDFWRVLKADHEKKDLILYAEMKLPGEAWLEFQIKDENKGPVLLQTAVFRPRGLLGRLYWYMLFPFHYFIFGNMAKNIASTKPDSSTSP